MQVDFDVLYDTVPRKKHFLVQWLMVVLSLIVFVLVVVLHRNMFVCNGEPGLQCCKENQYFGIVALDCKKMIMGDLINMWHQ